MSSKLAAVILPLFIFLTPLLFWNLSPNFFTTPQQFLVLLTGTILLVGYFSSLLRHRTLILPPASLTLPLFSLILAITLNLIVIPEGRPEALAGKGSLLLILPLISLLSLTYQERGKLVQHTLSALILVTTLLSIHSLLQLTFLSELSWIPSFMQHKTFTPTGSFLTTLIFMIIGGATAIASLKRAPLALKPLYLLVILLTTIGTVATLALMLPGSPLALNLIPYQATWSITLDSLKTLRSFFFGVGLSNFTNLYTAVKPLSLNSTPLWNVIPQTGSSELLTILTTTGILGALSLVWLMLKGISLANGSELKVPFLLTIIALILTPASIPLYVLFFVLLGLLGRPTLSGHTLTPRLSLGIGAVAITATLAAYVLLLRPFIAEYYMRQVQLSLLNNDGKAVYDQQAQALRWSPQITNYHLSYADINMRLASALSQKKDLTEADRDTISTLVQQAIREGKIAIQLRPTSSATWLALGKSYRNLINVAEGADRFAIDYYARAIALDPANPLLRVEYGGIFYQLGVSAKDPEDRTSYLGRARSEFQTAIQLRPAYANAYYNLSKLYEIESDYENASLAMQKVVANLDPASNESALALSQLEELKAKLPRPTPTPTPAPPIKELSVPSPLPSPLPGGPLDLSTENNTP